MSKNEGAKQSKVKWKLCEVCGKKSKKILCHEHKEFVQYSGFS